jgi:Nif-specific regulatory protein
MAPVFALLERAASSAVPVLICGATGTGKEVVARSIHRASARRKAAFIGFNCAATPESLLESELFGHRRGSFTGADRDHKGLFEEAHGGTLFLDEVSETSPAFQAKLLRVLQEGEVRPVGAARSRRVDVRIIAATNRTLHEEVGAGRFREDLYYRLAVFPISIPPLHRRTEDIVPLAEYFLKRYGQREGKRLDGFSKPARDLLIAYAWPGNVRELENEVQRAVVLAEEGVPLTPALFSNRLRGSLAEMGGAYQPGETLREAAGRYEAWIIRKELSAHQGSRTKTARALGLTREGLYKKMKRLRVSWE